MQPVNAHRRFPTKTLVSSDSCHPYNVTISADITAMKKFVPRGQTTCADAYLMPCTRACVDKFTQGFDSDFATNVHVTLMQSDGELCSMGALSQLQGGVVGYISTQLLVLPPAIIARSGTGSC